jgi:hypothetical protein
VDPARCGVIAAGGQASPLHRTGGGITLGVMTVESFSSTIMSAILDVGAPVRALRSAISQIVSKMCIVQVPKKVEPIAACEEVIASFFMPPRIEFGGNRAFYSPAEGRWPVPSDFRWPPTLDELAKT